jgi:hypothetical protein
MFFSNSKRTPRLSGSLVTGPVGEIKKPVDAFNEPRRGEWLAEE